MSDTARLAARTLLASFDGAVLPEWARARLAAGLGGVCLYGTNAPDHFTIANLDNAIHDANSAAITALDEEGGDVTRLYYRVGSPHAGHAVLGAADDLTLTEQVARDIGAELLAVGVDLDLGPVADVNSNPLNPVIGVRSFGADPDLVARHTATWVRGVQAGGAGACLKHYPGHGDTTDDSHLALPVVDASLDTLNQRELVPFRAGLAAGATAVMTSHVVVRSLDPTRPATFSPKATRLLRAPVAAGGLGFEGLLVSDALDMKGASGEIGVPAAAVAALAAGVDLLCLGPSFTDPDVQDVLDEIVEAVVDGRLASARLQEAASRVDGASTRLATLRRSVEIGEFSGENPHTATRSASQRAAALAISLVGPLQPCTGATVVRLVTGASLAVGLAPWGLPERGQVRGGQGMVDVHEDDPLPRLDEDRPVVVLTRGGQRHPWVGRALDELVRQRPDLVVVELGWPSPEPVAARTVVHTMGSSAVSTVALDRFLARGES